PADSARPLRGLGLQPRGYRRFAEWVLPGQPAGHRARSGTAGRSFLHSDRAGPPAHHHPRSRVPDSHEQRSTIMSTDQEARMSRLDTAEVIERFNSAFVERDPDLLTDLVAESCVMEAVQPAPDGARYEGRDSCLSFWKALIDDPTGAFEPE